MDVSPEPLQQEGYWDGLSEAVLLPAGGRNEKDAWQLAENPLHLFCVKCFSMLPVRFPLRYVFLLYRLVFCSK